MTIDALPTRLHPLLVSALLGVSSLGFPACVESGPCANGVTRCAAGAPIATGTVPNDVRLSRCGDTEVAVVPASFDARIDALALDGRAIGSVFLGVDASPWAVAGEAGTLVATLYGTNEVVALDVCEGTERGRSVISDLIEVSPAVTLREPRDVDGDGAADSSVTQMLPRAPQAVTVAGGSAFVAYTNLLAPSLRAEEPPLFGPGTLARFSINEDGLTVRDVQVLPCVNPQGLLHSGDVLWVSCSGPLGPSASGAQTALADGVLLAVDPASLEVVRAIAMARFAPATPALVGERIVVGSLVTPRVAILPLDAASLDDAVIVDLPGDEVDSVFEVVTLGDQALVPVFSLDALFRLDPLDPPASLPLEDAYSVRPAGSASRGLLALDVREGFSVEGLALLGLSAEVVPFFVDGARTP